MNSSDYTGISRCSFLGASENIQLEAASDSDYENMFVRVGANGLLNLFRAPNQDEVWTDTDTANVALTTTVNELLSITIDQEVTADDGSFSVSGKLDNTGNSTKTVTIEAFDDGVSVGSQDVPLAKSEIGKVFLFSGALGSSMASGSVVTFEFTGSDTGINLRGDQTTTTAKITKANANPVILSSMDTNIVPAILKAAETLTGFDREDMDLGGKKNGILQYCQSASSGEIHQIAEDEAGTYTLLTGQTVFADGSALEDLTLMQYHAAGETLFSYWYHGELIEVTGAKKILLHADFKGYVVFDDSGELVDSVTAARQLIVREGLVAYIYLNTTKSTIEWFADERHGIVEDGQTHLMTHMSTGFFVAYGLEFSGIANNGTTFTALSAGACGDEDVKMTIAELTSIPKMYMEGAANEWTITDDDNSLGVFRDSKCCYNDVSGTPQLVEIDSDYVVMTPSVTNNKIHPVVNLVGQKLHANRGAARDESGAEYQRMRTEGLPAPEMKTLISYIIHDESDGQIELGSDGEIYVVHSKKGDSYGIF